MIFKLPRNSPKNFPSSLLPQFVSRSHKYCYSLCVYTSSSARMSLSVSPPFSLQLSALSRENQRLRRQLEEERSMRRQGERLLPPPPTSQQGSSLHLPLSLSACPPPPSTSLPSSLRLPYSLSLDTATGDIDGILTQIKLSGAGLERPGESQALGEAFWNRPTASLGDARSGRTNRDLTK